MTGFDYERCVAFIDAIDGELPARADRVLTAIDEIGITTGDFLELDERPGQFDSHYRDHTWHAALRQVRNNPTGDLFDRLAVNSRGA